MARSNWILPRADAACKKVFLPDRRTAEGHRIALELWIQATGRGRAGYRLAAYRCKQCGGFHLGRKKVEARQPDAMASHLAAVSNAPWDDEGAVPMGDARPMDAAPACEKNFWMFN